MTSAIGVSTHIHQVRVDIPADWQSMEACITLHHTVQCNGRAIANLSFDRHLYQRVSMVLGWH